MRRLNPATNEMESGTHTSCTVIELDPTNTRQPLELKLSNDGVLQSRPDARKSTSPLQLARSSIARLRSLVLATFVPIGYPDSVSPEYLRYQIWDTLQALCSYLRGIIATAKLMEGMGVGSSEATPLAAAVLWVLRDGAGMVGGLFFASVFAADFDQNVKWWRLFADLVNDLGLTLDMLAPLAGQQYFLYVASVACVFKAMCGVSAGASKAAITAHFAQRGNMADLQCKEGSQETLVTLVGLLCGVYFAQVANESLASIWAGFGLLTALHVYANYQGVKSLQLRTLNPTRTTILLQRFLAKLPLSPQAVALEEPILLWRNSRVNMGAQWRAGWGGVHSQNKKAMVCLHRGAAHVVLHAEADASDELQAFCQACGMLSGAQGLGAALLERFRGELEANGWDTAQVCLGTKGWRYEWCLQ